MEKSVMFWTSWLTYSKEAESADVSIWNFIYPDDRLKRHEETVDRKTVNKGSGRQTKMLRSTAAASVLEFDQTLSLKIC